jgi:hypothetical protein
MSTCSVRKLFHRSALVKGQQYIRRTGNRGLLAEHVGSSLFGCLVACGDAAHDIPCEYRSFGFAAQACRNLSYRAGRIGRPDGKQRSTSAASRLEQAAEIFCGSNH